MNKLGWKFIPLCIFLSLCVFFWRGLSLDPHHIPSTQIGKALPHFMLPELGKPTKVFDSSHLPNQVLLLNVWASWCAACLEEQVFMMQLAREGVTIYGLNYKDDRKEAMQWLKSWGNPYERVLQDSEGSVAIDLGVYGAPETFVIDKNGIIRYRHIGILNQEVWDRDVLPLIKQLEQSV